MAETPGTDPGLGRIGVGTTLVGAVSGAIGMITNINIGGVEVADIDVTTLNNAAATRFRVWIAGLKDSAEFTLTVIYESVNMALLIARTGAANETWTVTLPDGSTFVQLGHIKKLGLTIPFEDKMMTPVTFKMSGAPAFTAGSA